MPLVYAFTLMLFSLHRAYILWKEIGGFSGMRLLSVLMRDQALYFTACVLFDL